MTEAFDLSDSYCSLRPQFAEVREACIVAVAQRFRCFDGIKGFPVSQNFLHGQQFANVGENGQLAQGLFKYNQFMKPILALETSTATCGVAVYSHEDGQELLFYREIEGVGGHARNILPLVDEVLQQAGIGRSDLRAVVFGQGPGGFTGVRLGCSVAQGLGYALGIPLVQVGELDALAHSDSASAVQGIRIAALDARMKEIYLAVYGPQSTAVPYCPAGRQLQAPVLMRAQDCEKFISDRLSYWLRAAGEFLDVTLVGEGWELVDRDSLSARLQSLCPGMRMRKSQGSGIAHVADVARLGYQLLQNGMTVDPAAALPLYLRDKVAFTTDERAQGLGGNPQAEMKNDVLVLPMAEQDLAEVIEIERQSQAFPWSEKNFRDSFAAGCPAWVLRKAGQMVGFCVCLVSPDEVHVLLIAVAPGFRRQGYGTLLFQQVMLLAQQCGALRILLEVRHSNEKALAFYREMGFEQIGLRRGYYPAAHGVREDACVMAKPLHVEQESHA